MELRRVPKISDPSGMCLGEVQNEAEDVSDDIRTRWGMFSMGPRAVIC